MIRHAGLIARRHSGAWRGALIEGPSGAGKSDLALRAISDGFRLVADDRTLLFVSGGRLFGRAPAPLHGLLEARGVGILRVAALEFAPVDLWVRCKMSPEEVERLPSPAAAVLLGVSLPVMEMWPLEFSAPAKLRRAIEHLGAGD